jgi:hypothetical protein
VTTLLRLPTVGQCLRVDDGYEIPSFVNEGMRVLAPYKHEGQWKGLWCTVDKAAGTSAHVVNAVFDFEGWFELDELRVRSS